jgi:FkbM family methyltransferase
MGDLSLRLSKLLGRREGHRKFMQRTQAAIARKPRWFLELCQSLRVDKVSLPYLDQYRIDVDVFGGVIAQEILRQGHYQLELMHVVDRLLSRKPPLFVNVGANIGTSILNAHSVGFTEFIAFEPVARNFQMLEHNMRANGLVGDCHRCALGSAPGRAEINLHPTSAGGHSLKSVFEGNQTETVSIETLDSFAVDQPHFLWIDAEGFELEILTGARHTLERQSVGICVEITPAISGPETADVIFRLLGERFDQFYGATGEPIHLDETRRCVASGGVIQLDLIAVDSRKVGLSA